jgi:hypothetical protein
MSALATASPWIVALLIVGLPAFGLGFFIRPFFTSGASSPPAGPFPTPEQLKELLMVYPEVQQALDQLNAAVANLPANVATAVAAGSAEAQQDKADTIAAVEASTKAASDAIEAVGVPATPPTEPAQ